MIFGGGITLCTKDEDDMPVYSLDIQRADDIAEKGKLIFSKDYTIDLNKVVTDSGGLQCEAFYAGVQCVLVLDYVVWPETMVYNRNQLAKPKKEDILAKLSAKQYVDKDYKPFGDGHAAEKITQLITEFFENRK